MADVLGEQIVVVSGLPRSGTSMMMRMLEAGGAPVLVDETRHADIDNPNGYYEYEPVLRLKRDSSWVHLACGKAVKIVYALLPHLPEKYAYKVIFMDREIKEVIASQEVMLQRKGKAPGGQPDTDLAGIFKSELDSFFNWARSRPGLELLRLDYHAVLHDPRSAASEISRFLDAALDVEAMSKVCNPDLYRQRR